MFSRFHRRLFLAIALLLTALVAALSFVALAAINSVQTTTAVGLAQSYWTMGAGIALLIGLAAAFFVSLRLAAPLEDLVDTAQTLGAEDDGPSSNTHENEVDLLSSALRAAHRRSQDATDALARDRERLHAVLSGMTDGVLAVDAEERVLHMNQVAFEQLEVAGHLTDVIGQPLVQVTRDARVLMAVSEALESNVQVARSFVRGSDSRTERAIELTANGLYSDGEEQEATGAVVVLHDVTRLEKLEGVRRDFVSNVSHELKTPLTAIRGFVESLIDAEDLDRDTQKRFLERIRVQTTRLSDLVGDLLSLSRIESGSVETPSEPIDARQVVSETVRSLRPESEARTVGLSVAMDDLPLLVLADAEPLRQAVANLIGNALKYSERGGQVAVRLFGRQQQLVFEVQDWGPGIAEEQQARIFERFYRVDKARSRELGGTGLGLAIVKNIAAVLGGQVEVESEVGSGSTFRMILPLAG